MDVWLELQKLRSVTIRIRGGNASIKLNDVHNHKIVRFHARLKRNETIEAMIVRALGEMQRRTLEGMPVTSQKVKDQRKLRKLLHTANTVPM